MLLVLARKKDLEFPALNFFSVCLENWQYFLSWAYILYERIVLFFRVVSVYRVVCQIFLYKYKCRDADLETIFAIYINMCRDADLETIFAIYINK